MSDRIDISRLMVEMRSMKSQMHAFQQPQNEAIRGLDRLRNREPMGVEAPRDTTSFGDLFARAVNTVNEVQHNSGALSKAYQQGDPNVDISEVMIASQKAGVSFQAMVQVRNKLLDAYRDVMNMPI